MHNFKQIMFPLLVSAYSLKEEERKGEKGGKKERKKGRKEWKEGFELDPYFLNIYINKSVFGGQISLENT